MNKSPVGGQPWVFLDSREAALLERVFTLVGSPGNAERLRLESARDRLEGLASLVADSPSIRGSQQMRHSVDHGSETLLDVLCRVPDYDFELHIPTKAVLGQAYLVAKINFLKALEYAVKACDGSIELQDEIQDEVAQSIYSKMAEELFISIVTDNHALRQVRERAAGFLFRIWDDRLMVEIDDFAPLLEAAWKARNRVRPVLGTMLGTQELMRLFQTAYDTHFLDFFGSDECSDEQIEAFEEFLFGISHEEIGRLRDHMAQKGKAVISESEARATLGLDSMTWPEAPDPHAVYTSYKRRKIKAVYRELTGSVGPKRTAEEYVMLSYLLQLPESEYPRLSGSLHPASLP